MLNKKIVCAFLVFVTLNIIGSYRPEVVFNWRYGYKQRVGGYGYKQRVRENITKHNRTGGSLINAQSLGYSRRNTHSTGHNTMEYQNFFYHYEVRIKDYYASNKIDSRALQKIRCELVKEFEAKNRVALNQCFISLSVDQLERVVEQLKKEIKSHKSEIGYAQNSYYKAKKNKANKRGTISLRSKHLCSLERELADKQSELNIAIKTLEDFNDAAFQSRTKESKKFNEIVENSQKLEKKIDTSRVGYLDLKQINLYFKVNKRNTKPGYFDRLEMDFIKRKEASVKEELEIELQHFENLSIEDKKVFVQYLKNRETATSLEYSNAVTAVMNAKQLYSRACLGKDKKHTSLCKAEKEYLELQVKNKIIKKRLKEYDALLGEEIKRSKELKILEQAKKENFSKKVYASVDEKTEMASEEVSQEVYETDKIIEKEHKVSALVDEKLERPLEEFSQRAYEGAKRLAKEYNVSTAENEEEPNNIKSKRKEAIDKTIENNNEFTLKNYSISNNLEDALAKNDIKSDSLKQVTGNEIQHCLNQECIDLSETFIALGVDEEGLEDLIELSLKFTHTADCFNKMGNTVEAVSWLDVGHILFDCSKYLAMAPFKIAAQKGEIEKKLGVAVAKGSVKGVKNTAHNLRYPIEFFENISTAMTFIGVKLAYYMDQDDFEKILVWGVNEKAEMQKKDRFVQEIDFVKNMLVKHAEERGVYGLVEDGTASFVEGYLTGKAFCSIGRFFKAVPGKTITLAGNLKHTGNLKLLETLNLEKFKAVCLYDLKEGLFKECAKIRKTVEGYIDIDVAKKGVKRVVRAGTKEAKIPAEVQGRMWLANATKEQKVISFERFKRWLQEAEARMWRTAYERRVGNDPQGLVEALSRGKVFERVHDLDCREIFKLYGDKLMITNQDIISFNISEMNWNGDAIKHILGKEIKPNGKWSGWHVDHNLHGVREFENIRNISIAVDPNTNINVLKIVTESGRTMYKSRFPKSMSGAEAFGEVLDSVNNTFEKVIELQGPRIAITSKSKNLLPIKTVLEISSGKVVTAFPCFEVSYMENLHYIDITEFLRNL